MNTTSITTLSVGRGEMKPIHRPWSHSAADERQFDFSLFSVKKTTNI